jgi:hypothetical protein
VQNNVNGVNADLDGDGMGTEYHSLASPAVVDLQKAYVRKVIDTLNDLDNVLYEIANESIPESRDWQYEMIRIVKQYQSKKPKQHPVVMSVYWPGDSTPALFASPADAVAPSRYRDDPPAATGEKVVFADQDHNGWNNKDPRYVWKNFLRGNNVVLYDPDVIPFDWGRGEMRPDDNSREPIRRAVKNTRAWAERINLAEMTPQGILSSTDYCLAKTGSEYLVYQPDSGEFSVSLKAGEYAYEWFDPSKGSGVESGSLVAAGGNHSFKPPVGGGAVLYLKAQQADPASKDTRCSPTCCVDALLAPRQPASDALPAGDCGHLSSFALEGSLMKRICGWLVAAVCWWAEAQGPVRWKLPRARK